MLHIIIYNNKGKIMAASPNSLEYWKAEVGSVLKIYLDAVEGVFGGFGDAYRHAAAVGGMRELPSLESLGFGAF